ncbi:uncharacterized protein LOC111602941 isoform X2 [Drosophila hydei]|uniref:Uncharacterized protein LOC111602941 isoform X2 n=1 Tax=Drosophila hydei TaxID=7224 RepID=A0A6J1M9X3_DROHY|nr:uncharacterized protein LOC111602941 isoform X2 [Drosophila hydei]
MVKRGGRNSLYNGSLAIRQQSAQNCLIVQFYEREIETESKIFNLLFYAKATRRERKHTERTRSIDAEIIFGSCDCGNLFCSRRSWDRSRIDWLWKLEQQQSRLRHITKGSKPSTDLISKTTSKASQKKMNYWNWLRFSCICASDTESCDLPCHISTTA